MFTTAASWLEKNVPYINSLNVFPVPDGDTGTNLLLTMRSALEAISKSDESGASETAIAQAGGLPGRIGKTHNPSWMKRRQDSAPRR